MKIFVGGIPHSVDDNSFKDFFTQFGEVSEAWLMHDPQTQRPRGFGFVVFATEEAMDLCLQKTHHDMSGKMVEARPLPQRPPPSPASFPQPFWPVPSSPHTFTPRWRQVKRATPRSANPPPPRGNFRGGGMGMGGGMGGYGGGMMGGGYGGGMMGGVGTTEP